MFVSEYFQLSDKQLEKMSDMGVFDALIDKDNNFFINIIRLKQSAITEFVEAYAHLNRYFSEIATLKREKYTRFYTRFGFIFLHAGCKITKGSTVTVQYFSCNKQKAA